MLGAPGCARSPKENGFDWILMRLLAGLAGDARGHHRLRRRRAADGNRHPAAAARRAGAGARPAHRAIVLAAGRSTRMGGPNKLLAEIGGRPLVRIAVEQALASRARPVIVVTGHQRDKRRSGARRADGRFVHNPDFADGLCDFAQGRHRRSAGGG